MESPGKAEPLTLVLAALVVLTTLGPLAWLAYEGIVAAYFKLMGRLALQRHCRRMPEIHRRAEAAREMDRRVNG